MAVETAVAAAGSFADHSFADRIVAAAEAGSSADRIVAAAVAGSSAVQPGSAAAALNQRMAGNIVEVAG